MPSTKKYTCLSLVPLLTRLALVSAVPPSGLHGAGGTGYGGGGGGGVTGGCGFPLTMCGDSCCHFADCRSGQCVSSTPPPNTVWCGTAYCDTTSHFCISGTMCVPQMVIIEPRTNYQFGIDSIEIDRTRSKETDTLFLSASVAVAGRDPVQVSMPIGNHRDGMIYPDVNLPIALADNEVALFSYLILNAGNKDPDVVISTLESTTKQIAETGAAAAAKTIGSLAGAAAGAEIGALIGSSVPVIGTIIGSALGALIGTFFKDIIDLIDPDCDGPVASGAYALSGANIVASNGTFIHRDYNPGTNSADGCGENSLYYTTWGAHRV